MFALALGATALNRLLSPTSDPVYGSVLNRASTVDSELTSRCDQVLRPLQLQGGAAVLAFAIASLVAWLTLTRASQMVGSRARSWVSTSKNDERSRRKQRNSGPKQHASQDDGLRSRAWPKFDIHNWIVEPCERRQSHASRLIFDRPDVEFKRGCRLIGGRLLDRFANDLDTRRHRISLNRHVTKGFVVISKNGHGDAAPSPERSTSSTRIFVGNGDRSVDATEMPRTEGWVSPIPVGSASNQRRAHHGCGCRGDRTVSSIGCRGGPVSLTCRRGRSAAEAFAGAFAGHVEFVADQRPGVALGSGVRDCRGEGVVGGELGAFGGA